MERPSRHRELLRDGSKKTRLLLPWSDNLIGWDGVDYRPVDNSPAWRTPSMTSGSSQPSTLNITPETETRWDQTQESTIDPTIAHITSSAESEWETESSSSGRLCSINGDCFLEYATGCEDSSSGISGYTGSDSYESDFDDGENVSDDEAEWCEDDRIATIVTRIVPGEPLAAYVISVLNREYNAYSGSPTNFTENVVPLREDIRKDGESLETSAASGTSNSHQEKRSRKAEEPGDDEDEDDGGDDEDKRKPKRLKGKSLFHSSSVQGMRTSSMERSKSLRRIFREYVCRMRRIVNSRQQLVCESSRPSGNEEGDRAEPIPRLACPFHKKDPNKYNIQFDEAGDDTADKSKKTEYRACAGPGFKNIQRLKEHLKRKHYPVQCDRCYRIFPGSRTAAMPELEKHRQLSTPCERKDSSLKEGISDAQWAQLDKKTSSKDSVSTTVVEKWNHIWGVLFPDTPLPATPWYDTPSRELTLPSEESRPFLDLFKQMLDHQVTHQDIKFPEDAEDTMKARVVTLVEKAFAVYSALNGSSPTNSTSTRSMKHTSTSGSSIQPVFSVANSRLNRASTMSSTSAPSSAFSMDSPESVEGMNYSPTILNVSNPLGGQSVLVESPLPSSDLDIVPGIKRVFTGLNVVVNRNPPTEGPRSGVEDDAAQN